jgi:hypothetical protein
MIMTFWWVSSPNSYREVQRFIGTVRLSSSRHVHKVPLFENGRGVSNLAMSQASARFLPTGGAGKGFNQATGCTITIRFVRPFP